MGSYPVSEYSELRHWRNVRRGSLDGVMMLLGGFEVLEGVWGVAEAEW
jgi:hypothetical protein